MPTVVNANSEVYYRGQYWNDLPQVLEYMCENFTGDKTKWWVQDFKDRYASKPFEYGLFLNCGNGWVERDFIDKNIVKRCVAFDYSLDLLLDAKGARDGREIDYFLTDANTVFFGDNQFDLIVNVAALHHVQYINRIGYILARALKPGGLFVHFDYIGPRRNQYSWLHWYRIRRTNNSLPPVIKKTPLNRPHLPTMLHVDPTEAIHSNLTLRIVARYFDIIERHDTGGGLAYEILTHNSKTQDSPASELSPYIEKILRLDEEYTAAKIVPSLFSYFIARGNKQKLNNTLILKGYRKAENIRENIAQRIGGVYSLRSFLNILVHRLRMRLAFRSRLRQIILIIKTNIRRI